MTYAESVSAPTPATRDDRPPMVVLRERLASREAELRAALGPDIPVAMFVRAVMTSVALNPDLLGCTWNSMWMACLKACREGLLPDGVDAAIVPFKTTAQFIPMYQGMLRRFRRSGQFKWVTAGLVRQGEEFQHFIDETGEHFKHVPGDDFNAPIKKLYALATTKEGGVFVAVMLIAEANKIKGISKTTREDSPWKLWPEEMYKKTVLRRLAKYLPSARDVMPEEELPEIEAPRAAPELPPSNTTKTALPASTEGAAAGGDGEQQGASAATDVEVRPPLEAAGDSAAITTESDDELKAAHERGKQDRASGVQRRTAPAEYRDPNRPRLSLAWQAGFDGREF